MDKYIKTLQKLNNVNITRGMKLSLENIYQASKILDFPQNKLKFIHVAGTNGKGSISLKISKILELAGYKTGLYTSPHLFSFLERIQYLTLLSFIHFKQNKVDVVSCEVGLGGRLDATNVIQNSLGSIISSISFDHCSSLGYTLRAIATEKAGIIKQGCPVIVGPHTEPYDVYRDICLKLNSPLHIIEQNQDILFDYNKENNLVTQESMQFMKLHNPDFFKQVTDQHINQGLQFTQRCRLELLRYKDKYEIYFDVGHNETGIEKTLTYLSHHFPGKKLKAVVGFSKQKEIDKCLLMLLKYCDKIHIIQANHYRAMEMAILQEQLRNVLYLVKNNNQIQDIIENGNIQSTLNEALRTHHEDEIIVILGSFYLMREAREYFGVEEQKDPIELQERVIASQIQQ